MNSLRFVATAIALACLTLSARAEAPPKFADYPVRVYAGKIAIPRLVTPDLRARRETFLAAADDGKIDAAGRYIVVKLPCGSTCVAPTLLDARTGKIIELFTVSGWHEVSDDFDPVVSRANSRMIVFRGARNEAGIVGNHFYLIEERGRLKHLHTQDTQANFETSPKIK
ncbi:hypothetical protein JQ609_04860 [Bradyrhizobium sp. AUGA SZCCT0169]|uniref:hypothetical protein n=1 Tax=unclassified Bradyrhizobium TaxID=2631580 RepID=UPI001BACF969|nr:MULTISPECIES: hypothetical protein [unclassified Bradyrhizobium]MBR1197646.1 hypothetical protein [Bradyrhizobium sp. AUGA SZCCT0158]MBR1244020.1 hypothetical protein [Bradyrhizobium sp. AUGA SZCCT0274]MBR1246260.1 hypothetical protein [Bradyrhizobium sp. AUGA SZCCT0169]